MLIAVQYRFCTRVIKSHVFLSIQINHKYCTVFFVTQLQFLVVFADTFLSSTSPTHRTNLQWTPLKGHLVSTMTNFCNFQKNHISLLQTATLNQNLRKRLVRKTIKSSICQSRILLTCHLQTNPYSTISELGFQCS